MEGLQCWDAQGREVFNSQTRTLRFVATISRSVGNWRGRISDARITENSILTGTVYTVNRTTDPVSLTAGNGYAGYFTYLAGTITVNIFEY